jgi:hypothetical protein
MAIRIAHYQHTEKYNKEVNSVKNVPVSPFRFYDEIWIIGKYKGIKLDSTPKSYINWAIKNIKLSETALSILKSKI